MMTSFHTFIKKQEQVKSESENILTWIAETSLKSKRNPGVRDQGEGK